MNWSNKKPLIILITILILTIILSIIFAYNSESIFKKLGFLDNSIEKSVIISDSLDISKDEYVEKYIRVGEKFQESEYIEPISLTRRDSTFSVKSGILDFKTLMFTIRNNKIRRVWQTSNISIRFY